MYNYNYTNIKTKKYDYYDYYKNLESLIAISLD